MTVSSKNKLTFASTVSPNCTLAGLAVADDPASGSKSLKGWTLKTIPGSSDKRLSKSINSFGNDAGLLLSASAFTGSKKNTTFMVHRRS